MAVKITRNADSSVARMDFTCDAMGGCDQSPTDEEIIAAGGLLKMGWTRRFNERTRTYEHFCPKHKQEV